MTATARAELAKPKTKGKQQAAQAIYHGDLGPDTDAQWERARPVPDYNKGGQGRIKQRETMHTILFRAEIIDVHEREAAARYLDAWEALDARGIVPWARPYVDGGGRPGDGLAHELDKQARFNELTRQIPEDCQYPILVIVLRQRRLKDFCSRGAEREVVKEKLTRGLSALARYLGC